MKATAFAAAALLVTVPLLALGASYVTKRGDTLQSVATANNMTVAQVATLNPLLVLQRGQTVTVSQAPTPTPTPTPTPSSGEITFLAYTTGYGWPDNTPKGSADISHPVLHQKAGGTGTYADPITLAVGHSISGGKDTLDYPAGTKFYIPTLKRYFIVEDTCGDGNTPQNGPCHTGYQGKVWIDLWVGGNASNQSATLACENKITGIHTVIQNPSATYPVVPGEIASNCVLY